MGEPRMAYVKLDEDNNTLQDIKPGELNEPIDVGKLTARKCTECGQELPQTYQPPSDEEWSTGIFGCTEDKDTCWLGLFCPCVLFGRNLENMNMGADLSENGACIGHVICVEGGMTLGTLTAIFYGVDPQTSFLICEGLFFAWWMCGIYTSMARQALQRKYHLKDSPCDPCMVHCCLHWCALCQEHREMRRHLMEIDADDPETSTNPPPVQEMIAAHDNEASTSSPRASHDSDYENNSISITTNHNNNLQLQVI